MVRIAIWAAAFTVIVGGILALYAFQTPEGIPGNMTVTAYAEPQTERTSGCVRRLTLVVTVLNTSGEQATIAAVRFLPAAGPSVAADFSPQRLAGEKQVQLRFEVAQVYRRLREQRAGESIERVEVRDGAGIRYRSPVALNTDAEICGQ